MAAKKAMLTALILLPSLGHADRIVSFGQAMDRPARPEPRARSEVATVEGTPVFQALYQWYQTRHGHNLGVIGAMTKAFAELDMSPGLTVATVEARAPVFRALFAWYYGRDGHDLRVFAARDKALAELDMSPGLTVAAVKARAPVFRALYQWYHGADGYDLGRLAARRLAFAVLAGTPDLTFATVEARAAVFHALYHWYYGRDGHDLDRLAARREAFAELERSPGLTVATVQARAPVFQALFARVVASPAEPADDECAICLDKENNCAFLPCRHTFCARCARRLRTRDCPLCRQHIQKIVALSSPDQLRRYLAMTDW